MNTPAPVPLTLLICDHVWRDPHSGKYDLLGTFSAIGSSVFPVTINLAVYFALTEGRGELPVQMELVDVDEERPAVFDVEGKFVFEHPRQVIEGCFAFDRLEIPEPGGVPSQAVRRGRIPDGTVTGCDGISLRRLIDVRERT